MTKATTVGTALAISLGLFLIAVTVALRTAERDEAAAEPRPPVTAPDAVEETAEPEPRPGFIYGRVTTEDGETYQGRLRWGGGEEAFWGDYLNGRKRENTWAARVPPERLPVERTPFGIFGIELMTFENALDLDRPFMQRFGDVARIESRGRDVRVTLKSGTVIDLDLWEAGDFDDGVRVWDATRGVLDIDSGRIDTIEFLPTTPLRAAPDRLHGTVRTRHGVFAGFVQWNREACVGTDELTARTNDGTSGLRFDTIRSIARRSPESALVTLRDGREIAIFDARGVGEGSRGTYVDDPRYGRVLISWDALERIDFSPADSGPAYDDFPPGGPLTGRVTTHDGRVLAGRLVYDLDESELTETFDAPAEGVDYTIPFGLIASIVLPDRPDARHAGVILHDGERLRLELAGDLGETNAGMLIFVDGRDSPEYVPWPDVERVDLDRPPALEPGDDELPGARPSETLRMEGP